MSGTTWSKFFWSDWDSDHTLRRCSFAARGFWMNMLCIAAANDPIGYLSIGRQPLGVTDIALTIGASETEAVALIGELERNGVFSRDRLGRIYSRRMVLDAKRSAEAKKNGKLGGNPSLRKDRGNSGGDNPQDKPRLKPHKPYASRKVEASKKASTLSTRDASLAPLESAAPPRDDPPPENRPPEAERKALAAEIVASLGGRMRTATKPDPPSTAPRQGPSAVFRVYGDDLSEPVLEAKTG